MFNVLLATVCHLRKAASKCFTNRSSRGKGKLRRLPVGWVSIVRFSDGNQRSINGFSKKTCEVCRGLANRGWRSAADDGLLTDRGIEVKGRRCPAYYLPDLLTVE